jgi:hypothetical protein
MDKLQFLKRNFEQQRDYCQMIIETVDIAIAETEKRKEAERELADLTEFMRERLELTSTERAAEPAHNIPSMETNYGRFKYVNGQIIKLPPERN